MVMWRVSRRLSGGCGARVEKEKVVSSTTFVTVRPP
jgi:hypothetical protein